MKYLLNLVIFGFVAWGIWRTASRWFDLLGGNRAPPPPQAPRDNQAGAPPRQVEDTRQCPVCGTFVAVGAGKCERKDCPQT